MVHSRVCSSRCLVLEPVHPAVLVPSAVSARCAFLGVFARFALFGMEKDHAKCTDCNLCLVHCQGADSPQGGVKWRQDECHMCLNCETACPEDVIKFRFLPNRQEHDRRRPTPTAAPCWPPRAAGAAFIPLARVADSHRRELPITRVIRPPGAVEERAFLERCIRCAECMKVCPNNALAPGLVRGRHRRLVDPDPDRAHRLLRELVRALRAGLPHRRDPEDHRERKARTGRGAGEDRHRLSTTTVAACRGRCRLPASCARSFAPPPRRRSGSRRSRRPFAIRSPAPTARSPEPCSAGEAAAPPRRPELVHRLRRL